MSDTEQPGCLFEPRGCLEGNAMFRTEAVTIMSSATRNTLPSSPSAVLSHLTACLKS